MSGHVIRSARRRWAVISALALLIGLALVPLGQPSSIAAPDPTKWGLTSFCTPAQDFPQSRRFRVTNNTGVATPAVLRNQTNGQTTSFTAPPGQSFHLVPANANPSSANTTQLIVEGVVVSTKAANNKACSVLVGNAVCDTSTGTFDITWTMLNNGTGPSTITASSLPGLVFAPNPVPANGRATATEEVEGPATGTVERTLTLTVDLGSSVIGNPTATVTLGQCERPVPPRIDFTFTKTADRSVADVGDVVTYTYAGQNTGEVALEVTQLVDDRLGVIIEDPDVETIVPPGGSIDRQVTYTVTSTDGAIGEIDNTAVVRVIPQSGPDREPRTANATETVTVRPPPSPVLRGNQSCDPESPGEGTLTWTLANGGPGEAVILGSDRPGVFESGTVAAGSDATDTEVVDTPETGTTEITLEVRVRGADPVSATITVAPCLAPIVTFTFTKTPSATTAEPGDEISYEYSGTNTGTTPLEILQLVDDRLGLLVSRPEETIVQPGEAYTESFLYTVTEEDADLGTIDNVGIVTVRPTTGPDREPRTATADARVTVTRPPAPAPALVGEAVCDPETGNYAVTWTLANSGDAPAVVTSASRPGTFAVGDVVAPNDDADARETIPGRPEGDPSEEVRLTVGIQGTEEVSFAVTIGQCGEPLPPVVDFVFTKTPSTERAKAGDVVTYTYRGRNTGEVPIEVQQLIDDRLGVVIRDPGVSTIVQPGESIVRTVSYRVTLDDAAFGRIDNIAVVTLQVEGEQEPRSAVAEALVRVDQVPVPPDPSPSPSPTPTSSPTPPPSTPSTPPSPPPSDGPHEPTTGDGGLADTGGPDASLLALAFAAVVCLAVGSTLLGRRRFSPSARSKT